MDRQRGKTRAEFRAAHALWLREPGEFRTAPLWGLRQTAPYLHDGSAESIRDAILLHFGEAEASKTAFEALSFDEQSKLLEFLLSL